jgi:ferric-dicitrate binding protein FerR (iron transport regulator)
MMMTNKTVDINEIIIRYLDASATQEEKICLLQWLKKSEKNRSDFVETRDLWLACEVVTDNELEVEIALDRFKSRILSERNRFPVRRERSSLFFIQVAAVFLLLIGIGYWFAIRPNFGTKELLVKNQIITANGSKGRFELPDGTIVWLNGNSKLTYWDSYTNGKRDVTLKGEAYFEVKKNANSPFSVQLGDLVIQVLGTKFNVSNYGTDRMIKTALLSGSIKITGSTFKNEVILKPDQLFTYSKQLNKGFVDKVEAQLYANWIKDKLIFDNEKLSDIMICLEGWYGVAFNCNKSFAENTRMSFTVRGESIDEILSAMEMIVPIKYDIKDNEVTIFPK